MSLPGHLAFARQIRFRCRNGDTRGPEEVSGIYLFAGTCDDLPVVEFAMVDGDDLDRYVWSADDCLPLHHYRGQWWGPWYPAPEQVETTRPDGDGKYWIRMTVRAPQFFGKGEFRHQVYGVGHEFAGLYDVVDNKLVAPTYAEEISVSFDDLEGSCWGPLLPPWTWEPTYGAI